MNFTYIQTYPGKNAYRASNMCTIMSIVGDPKDNETSLKR